MRSGAGSFSRRKVVDEVLLLRWPCLGQRCEPESFLWSHSFMISARLLGSFLLQRSLLVLFSGGLGVGSFLRLFSPMQLTSFQQFKFCGFGLQNIASFCELRNETSLYRPLVSKPNTLLPFSSRGYGLFIGQLLLSRAYCEGLDSSAFFLRWSGLRRVGARAGLRANCFFLKEESGWGELGVGEGGMGGVPVAQWAGLSICYIYFQLQLSCVLAQNQTWMEFATALIHLESNQWGFLPNYSCPSSESTVLGLVGSGGASGLIE